MSEWIAKPIKDGRKHLGDEYMGDLIRCKDCTRHDADGYCFEHGKKTDGADFCSWAKRREE